MIKNIQSLFYMDIILPLAVLLMKEHSEELEQVENSIYIAPPYSIYAF